MFGKIIKILFMLTFLAAFAAAIVSFTFSISYIPLNMHKKYFKEDNIVLKGYDVVKYFNEKKAQKGLNFYATKWDDYNWIFTSSGNMNVFKANPKKFAPQFGGYDAYWVTQDIAYPSDPTVFYLYKGKLYLFADEENKENFIKDIGNSIETAKINWNN